MRRSNSVMKVAMAAALIAIACYFVLSVFSSADIVQTALAVSVSAEQRGSAEGYAVRSETVLSGGGSTVSVIVEEGAKVSAGENIAIEYSNEQALSRAAEMRELRLRIQQLEDMTGVDAEESGKHAAKALANAVSHKNFAELDGVYIQIENSIFTENVSNAEQELVSMHSKLSQLQAQDSGGVNHISTRKSGTFSSQVDGFENVGPDNLLSLTPTKLQALFAEPENVPGGALGKLAVDIRWYFAAVMDYEQAKLLEENLGGEVQVEFTKTYKQKMMMHLESIGIEENGKCVVVFSAKRFLSDTISMREFTAEVVFSSLEGLRVPKRAIAVDEDGSYLFIVTGMRAEKIYVEIIGDYGDDYVLVRNLDSREGKLRDGSEIITQTAGVFDGKVVK